MTPQEQLLNIIKENSYNNFLLFFDGKPIKLEEIDFNKKVRFLLFLLKINH